jgi:hypothetical protein
MATFWGFAVEALFTRYRCNGRRFEPGEGTSKAVVGLLVAPSQSGTDGRRIPVLKSLLTTVMIGVAVTAGPGAVAAATPATTAAEQCPQDTHWSDELQICVDDTHW